MKLIATLAALSAGFTGSATVRADALDSWAGVWRGDCQLSPPGRVGMELRIEPMPGGLRWVMVYRTPRGDEVRDYRVVPNGPGRYVLDERNGILIDMVLRGDVLYDSFRIRQGNAPRIFGRHERRGRTMIVEMISQDERPSRSSGGGSVPTVDSYQVTGGQFCRLEQS
jgi:hypothetical protein